MASLLLSVSVAALFGPRMSMPRNVHAAYTREDDAFLWKNRKNAKTIAAAAEELGRGVKSCTARLERLSNPTTEGHRRLFGRTADDAADASLSSLRPVRDVMQRIEYDPALDPSSFVVGYKDRFQELPLEVAYDQPNDSIAGQERSFVQALPEHRIVFFKYKKRLVWHRPMRLDRVFGSHGTNVRLQDVVASYNLWERKRTDEVRIANLRAAAALGGSKELLKEVKLLLKKAARGGLPMSEFVDMALSPRYFGRRGGGGTSVLQMDSRSGSAGAGAVVGPDQDEATAAEEAELEVGAMAASALLELVSTLPEEHTPLRDDLRQLILERAPTRARGGVMNVWRSAAAAPASKAAQRSRRRLMDEFRDGQSFAQS